MSSLSNRAILVDLDISQWSARKLDKRETDEVLLRNGASRRAARVNKSLLPGAQSLEAVMKKATEIRTWFYERTLPWSGSARILRSDAYFDFVQELNSHVAAYEQRVDDFVRDYPHLVAYAQAELGSLYDPADYPPADVVRDKFRVESRFMPVPAADDWRVSLSDEALQQLRESIEKDVKRSAERAMREAWDRLYKCVSHAVDRLSDPENIFRDSLVKNAEELCRVLPTLNITGDPELEARRQELEEALCGVSPKDLRKFKDVREETAAKLREIQNKMSGLYGMAA